MTAPEGQLRRRFSAELDALHDRVEQLAVRVDQNLERMRMVLDHGDTAEGVAVALHADDVIDEMVLAMTEHCYDLIVQGQPVAGDMRLIVSVLRVVSDLERIGDLALRVVKLAPDQPALAASTEVYGLLCDLCDESIALYREALRAWSARDAGLAAELAAQSGAVDVLFERLMAAVMRLHGAEAVHVAVKAVTAARALERIGDHATIIGARLIYLLTGSSEHLAEEVR